MPKYTPNQAAFMREIRRLERLYTEAEEAGYHFSKVDIPTMPHRVTESELKRVRSITRDDIIKSAHRTSPEETERVSFRSPSTEEEIKLHKGRHGGGHGSGGNSGKQGGNGGRGGNPNPDTSGLHTPEATAKAAATRKANLERLKAEAPEEYAKRWQNVTRRAKAVAQSQGGDRMKQTAQRTDTSPHEEPPSFSETYLSNFYDTLTSGFAYPEDSTLDFVKSWIDTFISIYGVDYVASMLEQYRQEHSFGFMEAHYIKYAADYMFDFYKFLSNGMPDEEIVTVFSDLMDSLEAEEDWSGEAETPEIHLTYEPQPNDTTYEEFVKMWYSESLTPDQIRETIIPQIEGSTSLDFDQKQDLVEMFVNKFSE